MLEDSKIIELFFARVEQAIVELSAKYGTVCNRIARNILKNDLDAEECVNDTYLAAWNTIPPQNPDPLRTYIFRIVRNTAIAKYHANTSEKPAIMMLHWRNWKTALQHQVLWSRKSPQMNCQSRLTVSLPHWTKIAKCCLCVAIGIRTVFQTLQRGFISAIAMYLFGFHAYGIN